ncbi:hypothetical protein NQ315_003230 [Exocentrus adspersus]|uniref:DDE Tnp4 domain-containing protein n=1 Tax=Exocentrus adspersus TaxID=1586481 RepID=A0AAV8VM90_9CUCU|nr:hypothetical protein NQ315_003230 [Exocentrus adspersus]
MKGKHTITLGPKGMHIDSTMLPIHLYNMLILREENRRERIRGINQGRRLLRNNTDQFYMPDNQFESLFRLTKEMIATIMFPVLIPHLQNRSPLAILPEQKILISLHFYATGGYQKCIGLDWGSPICDYDLEILNINARYGGSHHDSFIFRQSAVSIELERRYDAVWLYNQYYIFYLRIVPYYSLSDTNSWLLGDSGYPQKPYLMTPIINVDPGTPEYRYTRQHILARNAIEYKPYIAGDIANACAILHNICIKGRLDAPGNIPDEPLEQIGNVVDNVRDNRGIEARRILVQRYFQ